MMKRIFHVFLFLLCVMLISDTGAGAGSQSVRNKGEMTPLKTTLNTYREEGYTVLGPVQFLGRNSSNIQLYRRAPVPYRMMDVIGETGDKCYVNRHDFVYVLSRRGHVVLVRIDREDRDDV